MEAAAVGVLAQAPNREIRGWDMRSWDRIFGDGGRTQQRGVGLPSRRQPEAQLPKARWRSAVQQQRTAAKRIGIGGDGNADARQLCCAGGWVKPVTSHHCC